MREEYIGVIDEEIAHHESIYLKSQDVSPEYKDGFLSGLKHLKQLFVQIRAAEMYPDLAFKRIDEIRN